MTRITTTQPRTWTPTAVLSTQRRRMIPSFGSLRSHRLRIAMLGAVMLGMSLAASHTAHALVTGGPDILSPAPASMANTGGASNDHQQGFNEKQGFRAVV